MQDEGPKDAQQEPREDSELQTPQPDQPHPPVADTAEDSPPLEGGDTRDDQAEDSPPVEADDGDES